MILLAAFLAYAVALTLALGRAGLRNPAPAGGGAAGEPPDRVLIVGATGGTGRELVTQALDRGLTVTAFVRDRARLGITHPRLAIVQGDVLDAAGLAAAMRGQDAVLCALGHKRYFGPTRILSTGTANIVRAMEACGTRRLVCQTSLGIGGSAGRMGLAYTLFVLPVILPFYFWDKTRQEQLVARSEVEWVIVRPAALTDGGARGRWRAGPEVGNLVLTARIGRADTAAFMLEQLTSGDHLRRAVGVAW